MRTTHSGTTFYTNFSEELRIEAVELGTKKIMPVKIELEDRETVQQ